LQAAKTPKLRILRKKGGTNKGNTKMPKECRGTTEPKPDDGNVGEIGNRLSWLGAVTGKVKKAEKKTRLAGTCKKKRKEVKFTGTRSWKVNGKKRCVSKTSIEITHPKNKEKRL